MYQPGVKEMKQSESKKYKALISDIDGTLIPNNPHEIPSKRVVMTIKKASKIIHVGVATSRPFYHAERIINILDLSSPCIVGGGSQIVDPKTKKIIWEKRVSNKQVLELLGIFSANGVNIELIDDEDNIVKKVSNGYSPLQVWSPGIEPKEADKIIEVASNISTIAINKVPSYRDGKVALVFTHLHATKQYGILEVAKILKISPHEIIGIGDGYNDFPLLMACGLKVAIGNAVNDLKEIADYIAPPVEEDGVADVIEKFVLKNEKLD